MNRPFQLRKARLTPQTAASTRRCIDRKRLKALCVFSVGLISLAAGAQVVVVDTHAHGNGGTATVVGTVDRRFTQIQPTHVPLTQSELDARTRSEIIRLLSSEQGFAMRPFPRGHKGLTLVANGNLEPAGEPYLAMVTNEGLSAKPGDRVVLTDIKIEHSRIVFDLNGGPDRKHRFLRHIQLGSGPMMSPVVQGDDQEPMGARLTLRFEKAVPELTGSDVKALLSPLISFDVKTPIQAFTDTLPAKLKDAILNHHVLVGMSTDMVLFAKGQPENKSREMDGQMPFEEWIYGKAPKDVEFVRINGNRVIRVEIAKVGETPVIFDKDEVEGMMRTDGTPLTPGDPSEQRTVQIGDVQRDPDTQAPTAPPTLRKQGETTQMDDKAGVMKPVRFPKAKEEPAPDGSAAPTVDSATPDASQAKPAPAQPDASQPH